MLKKLGYIELFHSLKTTIECGTSYRLLGDVPENEPSPFYFLEFVGKREENTKTMWCEVHQVWIHVVAEASDSKEQVYEMIDALEEAMTVEISLPAHVELLYQRGEGILNLKQDESGEYHAIVPYEFKVSYGYRVKMI